MSWILGKLGIVTVLCVTGLQAADEPPREWIEPATGHRVIRLSREPGTSSLYFHQNAYTGNEMIVSTPDGLATIDLQTRAIKSIVEGRAGNVVVARKSPHVYYTRDGAVFATHVHTRTTRKIATFSREFGRGSGFAVNADETLLAGSYVEGGWRTNLPPPARSTPGSRLDNPPGKGSMLERRWAAALPMAIYIVNIESGEIKTFHHTTNWLNHVQFSPSDPRLIMFCHEGPWHKVDRIWTILTDGSGLRKIHTRMQEMEIAGHEFFSPDGKMIWYDLQTPKSKVFWLAGHELETGKLIKYRVEREHWSVHYNASPDGKLFAGDGGGPRSVAAPGNGQWIYLFTPRNGRLEAERLVDLSNHNYELEPNVSFTPDGKWIAFRSNMHGPTHVYAVEVKKSKRGE